MPNPYEQQQMAASGADPHKADLEGGYLPQPTEGPQQMMETGTARGLEHPSEQHKKPQKLLPQSQEGQERVHQQNTVVVEDYQEPLYAHRRVCID